MSYIIKRQKINKNGAMSAYIMEEFMSFDDFVEGIVDSAQTRGKGWKYRVMEVNGDADGCTIRFDVQFTKVE